MPSRYPQAPLERITTYSAEARSTKVNHDAFAKPLADPSGMAPFFDSLPDILAVRSLRAVTQALVASRTQGKAAICMMGAHVIKCGLVPLLRDLVDRGVLTCVSTNGAGAIHDVEIALLGRTSEEVDDTLADGRFGMVTETPDFINRALAEGAADGLGYGESLGRALDRQQPPFYRESLLWHCWNAGVPVTVHVALGTDTIHQHPSANGAAIGEASLRDFRILAHQVAHLDQGGVALNIGSTVIMPEVFLKCLSVARNLNGPVRDFTTATFDMIHHYRPRENVVRRPVLTGGKGVYIIGHHELMLPLLAAWVGLQLTREDQPVGDRSWMIQEVIHG